MNRQYMRRFITLREEENGGTGVAGGSASAVDNSASAANSTSTGSPAADTGAPKSMLEAIERGLNTQSADSGAAKPAAVDGTDAGKQTEDRSRDDQGRFAKKADEQNIDPAAKKAADDAAAKEKAAKEAEKATAKPGDDTQMPDGLTPKAQERFRTLTHRVQEATVRAERAESDLGEFRTLLANTGGRPEDFSQAFDYITAMNKGDFQTALNMLDAQRRQLSLLIGRPLPGADPLSEFPDLRQRVDAYQMDEQAAIEIARARKMDATRQDQQRRQTVESQQFQQAGQIRQQALADIDRLNKEWAARDPDFAAKEEIIFKQIPLIGQQFPPQMWAAQVRMLYETLSAMPAPVQRHQAAPAPLRPSGQQGGARKPANMLEALNSGLGYASN